MVRRRVVDLQVRKMPEQLREKLRRRAKGKGKSMSEYVIEVLRDDLERPTLDEWLDEIRQLPPVRWPPGVTGATLVREAREERERELNERFDRLMSRGDHQR